ncbi:hypothetical protein Moror_15156 [Moniliophthora roreri MCA 2997]|uniref:Uncharacterized protein n=1 Tax=Moniliophthora roreri (strain MCA 2997) TaxID=1381753 RepID=V2WIW6_MONRO|nr:hypothetical protein Moror_15156 [Moniliophthora roreri MCA 2997]
MSNAPSTSSSSSYFDRSLPNPPAGSPGQFSDDITYTSPFNPSPFELLFLVNTAGHDNALRNTAVGQPQLQFAIDSLICLWAQCASLNAIIEETNVYAANLAFNAMAKLQLHAQLFELGLLPLDVCDSNPNDPAFLRVAETYCARIGAAVELAQDQHQLCPRRTRAEPVLPRPISPAPLVPKLDPSSSFDSANVPKLEPPPSPISLSSLTYPPNSRDSSPLYTQSIGVTSASPSPASEPQPRPALTPPVFDPFNVDDKLLTPPSVPFLANRQFNPAFISIRDTVHANP